MPILLGILNGAMFWLYMTATWVCMFLLFTPILHKISFLSGFLFTCTYTYSKIRSMQFLLPFSGFLRLQSLTDVSEQVSSRIIFRRTTSVERLRHVMRDSSRHNWVAVVADLDINNQLALLRVALQLGLLTEQYSYLLANLDTALLIPQLSDYTYSAANIYFLNLVNYESPATKLIVGRMSVFDTQSRNQISAKQKELLVTNSKFISVLKGILSEDEFHVFFFIYTVLLCQ